MKTKNIVTGALLVALTAICSQIQIPIPMVPINLALFSVYLAATLLGPKDGTITMVAYVLLGAVGAPVFSGLSGGFGVIAGPTGGYIVGYIATALIVGLVVRKFGYKPLTLIIGMLAGLLSCYLIGTIWFMHVTGYTLAVSLTYCVIPFLPGDAVKIFLATTVTVRLRSSIPTLVYEKAAN